MTPQVALSTSDWIFLSGVIVNGLAFVGVIVSLLLLRAQGLTARDATLAVAYQNMAAQMADVARFFVDNSDLRPYFFGNKALPASRDEHNRVLAVAEMYVNFMDNVLTQSPVLACRNSRRLGGVLPRCLQDEPGDTRVLERARQRLVRAQPTSVALHPDSPRTVSADPLTPSEITSLDADVATHRQRNRTSRCATNR